MKSRVVFFSLMFFALLGSGGNASTPDSSTSQPFNHSTSTNSPGLSTSQPSNLSTHSYTNHAGNAIVGWPVKLTARQVTLVERVPDSQHSSTELPTIRPFNLSTTNTYPLSIFPESEQRRIAADFLLRQGSHLCQGYGGQAGGQVGLLRIPVSVKRAIAGAEKAMARSRKRAEKGLCTKEESDAFCEQSEAALKTYLDKQVKEGTITPAERKALRR